MTNYLTTGTRYWPRRASPFFLSAGTGIYPETLWDSSEVRDDLAHIRDMGFSFARVGVLWESLQLSPTSISTALLNRLVELLDAAEAAGVQVQLTVMGQLGGTLFVPDWLLVTDPETERLFPAAMGRVLAGTWETPLPLRNVYEDRAMLTAQVFLWNELGRTLGAHPALTMVDGGMGGLLTALPPRHPDFALTWWNTVREQSETTLEWLYSDSIAYLFQAGLPALREWGETVKTMTLALRVEGLNESGTIDPAWPAFQLLLARALAQRAVGCAQLGIASRSTIRTHREAAPPESGPNRFRPVSEELQARTFGEALPLLHSAAVPSLCHAVWADAPPTLWRTPPYDRFVALRHAGLIRADGVEKEAVQIWREFHATTGRAPLPETVSEIEVDNAEWVKWRNEPTYIMRLYAQWRGEF